MSDQRKTFSPKLIPEDVSQTPGEPAYMAVPVDECGHGLLPPGMVAGVLIENVKATWIGRLPDGDQRSGLYILDDKHRRFCIAIVEAPCFVDYLPLN